MTERSLALVIVVALSWSATVARADDVRDARRHYERAELERARAALDRAEASDGLTRDGLVELVELSLLVHLAGGDEDAARADVRRLAAIAPEHELGREVPPGMVEALREQVQARAGPLAARATVERGTGEVIVRGRAVGAPPGLVRAVRVHARAAGGQWADGEGEVTLPVAAGSIEHWVELLGPGGVLLAREGSADAPERFEVAAPPPPVEPLAAAEEDAGPGAALWIGVGAGAAVVVAVVVIAATVGGRGDDLQRFQPGTPVVDF